MDKVHGGTPKGCGSLCQTCRMSHRIRGVNLQEEIWCRAQGAVRVRFPVSECTLYDDKRVPSLYDMEQIAWHVTSSNRTALGFGGGKAADVHIEPPANTQLVPLRPDGAPR